VIRPFLRLAVFFLRSDYGSRLGYLPPLALTIAMLPHPLCAVQADSKSTAAATQTPQAAANTVSLAAYQARLQSLDQLVVSCQRAMIPANCQSEQVGPDLKLGLPSGPREIRLAWLRELLDSAGKDSAGKESTDKDQAAKDAANAKTAKAQAPKSDNRQQPPPLKPRPEFHPPTLAQQLEDARRRLAQDGRSAAQWAAQSSGQFSDKASSQPPGKSAANSTPEPSPQRQTLARILAAKEYHAAIARPSLMHQLLEKIGNWLDRVIAKLQQAGFRSRWVGLAAEIAFVVLLCLALAWFLIRLERQGRFGAARFRPEAATGAASARDWQLWLEDAGKAASQGAWRDAIHFLYWASISRLESGGLWPADRARTPREYLALLDGQSAQRTELATLTRSFERTWYAGRPALQADFAQAEQVAAKLGARLDARPDVKPRDSRGAQ
jgi:Domain of unknown function (DUF4129)